MQKSDLEVGTLGPFPPHRGPPRVVSQKCWSTKCPQSASGGPPALLVTSGSNLGHPEAISPLKKQALWQNSPRGCAPDPHFSYTHFQKFPRGCAPDPLKSAIIGTKAGGSDPPELPHLPLRRRVPAQSNRLVAGHAHDRGEGAARGRRTGSSAARAHGAHGQARAAAATVAQPHGHFAPALHAACGPDGIESHALCRKQLHLEASTHQSGCKPACERKQDVPSLTVR